MPAAALATPPAASDAEPRVLPASRVPGHVLRAKGAPFVVSETGDLVPAARAYSRTGGLGRGVCACGTMSDLLDTAGQRRRWHARHKLAVQMRAAGEPVDVVGLVEHTHDPTRTAPCACRQA